MVFRFAIFQLLGCFFCCLVFKVHSFFSLPSVVFYLAGLLVYITISFSVCQHLFLSFLSALSAFLSALSAFFSAVCFDAASPTSMVCSIYHIFFSLSILFFLYSFFFLFLKLQYQIELIPHYHLKVLSYLVLL